MCPMTSPFQRLIVRARVSRWSFCLLIAAIMVFLRVFLYDWTILTEQYIPNHDMSQGMAFVMTDLNAVHAYGDLAWWNPVSHNGYAQYFQAFFSPLAPTPGNIIF